MILISQFTQDENKRRDTPAAAVVAGHSAVRHPELFGARSAILEIPPTWVTKAFRAKQTLAREIESRTRTHWLDLWFMQVQNGPATGSRTRGCCPTMDWSSARSWPTTITFARGCSRQPATCSGWYDKDARTLFRLIYGALLLSSLNLCKHTHTHTQVDFAHREPCHLNLWWNRRVWGQLVSAWCVNKSKAPLEIFTLRIRIVNL